MLGCGRPPYSIWGGDASAMEPHAGDLRRHDVHDHARGQRRQPAWDVQADSAHRNHPASYHRTWRDTDLAAGVSELGFADSSAPLDRGAEGLSEIGMEPCCGIFQSCRRHPEVGRKHSIKTQGVISECGDAAPRDVFADWPNVLRRCGYVEFGPGHYGGVI